MRVHVINAFQRDGKNKTTLEPYTMFFVTIGLPFNNLEFKSGFKETGYGQNTAELPIEPELLQKFSFLNGKTAYMELTTVPKIIFGELKEVVIDAKVCSPETKAA